MIRESLREVALELSEEIIADFERLILPLLSGYREGFRYTEVLKVIEELKSGQFKEHPKIVSFSGMIADEISGFPELEDKLRSLNQLLLAGINFDQRSPTGL